MHADPPQHARLAKSGAAPLATPAAREADDADGLRGAHSDALSRGPHDKCGGSSLEATTRPTDAVVTAESIRRDVERSIGFASALHRQRWEEAWLGRLPLSSYLRHWGSAVVHAGAGLQLSRRGRVLQAWVQRYFVLAWSLLYIFDGDGSKDKCRGAVYLHRADVQKTRVSGRPVIVVTPVTPKKPPELGMETFASFTMSVEADRLLEIWFVALQKTSAAALSPGSAALQQTNTSGLALSPAREPQPQSQSQAVRVASTPEARLDAEGALPSPPASVVAAAATDAGDEAAAVNGLDTPSRNQVALWMRETGAEPSPRPEEQPQVTITANAAASAAPEDRETIIEAYRLQLQQVTVSASSVKARLRRMAERKDKLQLGEVLLQFVLSHVNDAAALWALIDHVDELPDALPQTPATSVPRSPSCRGGEGHSMLPGTSPGHAASNGTALRMSPNCVGRHLSSIEKVQTETREDGAVASPLSHTSRDTVGAVPSAAHAPHAVEVEWRQRMRRLQQRRGVIDSILSELPNFA
ncbi:uncharacterized protein Tco025E_03730 [Trypanosoma conorhini]|uniref:PH domain-containing protein n=1 Tax=Trypanosoma conorhini TaxID=83891 RepID=A0A3R7MUB8_9TRYP|nr:uncharacterized protein Tco025E_03730 [Trypanosoma conorhini]RNF20839.1 hypothetical protein Tco025E_03730 [Trypanosoma conorhini]